MGASLQQQLFLPVIDAVKLQSIKNLAEPNDADGFFRGLIDLFFVRSPTILREIEVAIEQQDPLLLEKAAHAIKGTAGNLGASLMMKLAEDLEQIGHDRHLEGAETILSELRSAFSLTREEIEKDWL